MSDTSSKKVVANSIIYSVSGLLLKCFSLFLLPLYTIYLTTEDYGITSVATSFAATMGYVVSLSLFSAVMRFYVDLKDDPKKLSRFYGTVVVFSLLSSILWGCVMTIFREPISHYIFSGVDYYPVILICLATLVFNVQHTIYTNILKSQQKALKSSILSIDYKFFCFNGTPEFIYVSQGLSNHATARISYVTMDWEAEPFYRNDFVQFEKIPPKPKNYDLMVQFSKLLAADYPFVRIDFYEIAGKLYFGEMTFYPGAGYTDFTPDEWNLYWGKKLVLPCKNRFETNK